MRIRTGEITEILRKQIQGYEAGVEVAEVGRVIEAGDGIARIYGLENVMAGELVEFPGSIFGVVFNLEEDNVGVVILGDYAEIKEGAVVTRTGRIIEVPVGEAMLGRVVDPLGQPIDGKGPISAGAYRPIERIAPSVVERQPVKEPLQTGLKAIDSMVPIGRGQRELIIGDRQTGKTAIAIDAIISQRDTDVVCIYVAIGQKQSSIARTVKVLEDHQAMAYTTVVAAPAHDPAPLLYVAPYAGCAMAEHFALRGGHVLVIYDDLSKQAAAYRQLSLLLRRPPGREAYPGDIFYCHSRLLERAVKLANEYVIVSADSPAEVERSTRGLDGVVYLRDEGPGSAAEARKKLQPGQKLAKLKGSGGSLTALPIIETQAGDVSAYIPTNVISITDGQIYLEPGLFYSGVRPAINVGLSVSRVGGAAQIKAMKKVAGSLRLELAQFRELEAFAQFGSDLDEDTRRRLARGERLVEVLKQDQYVPIPVSKQVVLIYSAVNGFLDALPVAQIRAYEQALFRGLDEKHPGICSKIMQRQELDDQLIGELDALLREFTASFSRDRVER